MKNLIFILLCGFCLTIQAKHTYLINYKTKITEDKIGVANLESDSISEISYLSDKLQIRITVVNPELSQDRLLALKNAENEAKFNSIMSTLNSTASVVSTVAGHSGYRLAEEAKMNLQNAEIAVSKINILEQIESVVIIENLSDEEKVVNDNVTGLTWYIRPHSLITNTRNNPAVIDYRIASISDISSPSYIDLNLESSIYILETLQETKNFVLGKCLSATDSNKKNPTYILRDKRDGQTFKMNQEQYDYNSKDNFYNFIKENILNK